jgi:hypothetical protein
MNEDHFLGENLKLESNADPLSQISIQTMLDSGKN